MCPIFPPTLYKCTSRMSIQFRAETHTRHTQTAQQLRCLWERAPSWHQLAAPKARTANWTTHILRVGNWQSVKKKPIIDTPYCVRNPYFDTQNQEFMPKFKSKQSCTRGTPSLPQSAIRSPRSAVRNPLSAVRNPQSAIRCPQFAIPSPQSAIRSPHFLPCQIKLSPSQQRERETTHYSPVKNEKKSRAPSHEHATFKLLKTVSVLWTQIRLFYRIKFNAF